MAIRSYDFLMPSHLTPTLALLLTALSMAVACAVLSVFVVSRRWAFIGEGISHSGFGGAGTAWLLALIAPQLDRPWLPYAGVVVICLLTGLLVGYFTRRERVNSDAAIGIFLVASLAWGILAQQIYHNVRHADPVGWEVFLFGRISDISLSFALAAAGVCAAVVVTVAMLDKEIVYYCFDPLMAETSGVHVGFIHYLLIILVTLTIVVGVRMVGNVLVTALLVLPGATALLVRADLRGCILTSLACSIAGTLAGLTINRLWPIVPTGPAIVLMLFCVFLGVYGFSRVLSQRRAGQAFSS